MSAIKKKGEALPLNIVVMLILGIVLFGLGLGLFSKISSSGDKQVEDLVNQVNEDIKSLECTGDAFICSPTQKAKLGSISTSYIFVSNRGDKTKSFSLKFKDMNSNKLIIEKEGCGQIEINYLESIKTNIKTGESSKIPFIINTKKVSKKGCSFTTVVELKESDSFVDNKNYKTPVIIVVE